MSGSRILQDGKLVGVVTDGAALQQVHGVGEKVALCVALFGYHRLEACPVDVWMRRVLDTQYGGAMPTRYRACAGVLQQYLFCLARSRRLR